ncbi:MAG: immunity 22 family protein [Acetatifactor sp.]
MIYDYEGQEGYVSLWAGRCRDSSTMSDYLTTEYLDEDFDGDAEKAEQKEIWQTRFDSANRSRACEEELKNMFNYEMFNRFEYDFGLSHDEDFREAKVLDHYTKDIKILFDRFSFYNTFIDAVEESGVAAYLPECNTAMVLYDFKYEGGIHTVQHEGISLYFLGYFYYSSEWSEQDEDTEESENHINWVY